jgi:dimethylargininase
MSTMRSCYHFNSAIVRTPAPSVVKGLRAEDHGTPDFSALCAEHEAYVTALRSAGLEITELPALHNYPDSVFVEDPALVFNEGAILLRPGAPSRQGESAEMAGALHSCFEKVLELEEPGHVDGGDILVTPDCICIGLSSRTDQIGAVALIKCLNSFGYKARIVTPPPGVLHLKTACSLLDEETLLLTAKMVQSGIFNDFRHIITPDEEQPAANAIRINDSVLLSSKYPRTAELLDKANYSVITVNTTEIEKLDAGVSCMSLRWYKSTSRENILRKKLDRLS